MRRHAKDYDIYGVFGEYDDHERAHMERLRAESRRLFRQPLNKPGPLRVVETEQGRRVGAMAHPVGRPHGFDREARVEPLDVRGRRENRYSQRRHERSVRGSDGRIYQAEYTSDPEGYIEHHAYNHQYESRMDEDRIDRRPSRSRSRSRR